VEIEDKNCASYNRNIRNNKEEITSEPSVAPKSPVGHGATEDYANEHCTHHLQGAGVNCSDLFFRSGLITRLPPNN
jgi:hypothetical protein